VIYGNGAVIYGNSKSLSSFRLISEGMSGTIPKTIH
jgi:hypothetical protein